MLFQRIEKESTRQKVYKTIRTAIMNGRLKVGQKLAEIPLASEFQVSRAIVREALQQLAHEGLVEQNSYKGARVVFLSPEQVDEIVSVRLLLEAEAVRLAKARLTDADRAAMRAAADQLRRAAGSTERFAELDLALHRRIWEISGNQTIAKLLGQITSTLFAMATVLRNARLQRGQSASAVPHGDHTTLVETICEGTEEEAVEAIRFHLTENWSVIRRLFGEYFEECQATKRERESVFAVEGS